MKLSLCYITSRLNPRWDLFIETFLMQTTAEERKDIQVIFVDGKLWYSEAHLQATSSSMMLAHHFYHDPKRRYDLEIAVGKRFDFLHIPPKPCLMQGPFRKTNRDFFCASNTRNTGIIAARGEYLVFVDDLSVVMPGWISQVWHAANSGYAVAGAYRKVLKLDLWSDDGESYRIDYEDSPQGWDSRWARGSDAGIMPIPGGGLFGCSFGARVEDLLRVDGSEMACNGGGGEDTDLGMRLERAGVKLYYNRNMLTLESEEGHHDGEVLPRQRRLVSKDRVPANYESWKVHNEEEKYWSDHVLLNRVCHETERITPILPEGLRAIRDEFLATGLVPIPTGPAVDWRDGTDLSLL